MIKLTFIILAIYFIYREIKKQKEKQKSRGPYGTGWIWNEEKQLWDPPKEKSQIKISRNGPSYEEWKAHRIKEEDNRTPKNKMSDDGSYRFDYIHLPNEEPIYSKPKEKPKPQTVTETKQEVKAPEKTTYEAKPLLTYNESRNYQTLFDAAERKGYRVCPKVRLADIITPHNNEKYMSNFGKIKAKHVDFAICDRYMKVLAVIELDDKSHDREDRKKRDEFVDSALKEAGIKIIHTRYITPDILDHI